MSQFFDSLKAIALSNKPQSEKVKEMQKANTSCTALSPTTKAVGTQTATSCRSRQAAIYALTKVRT